MFSGSKPPQKITSTDAPAFAILTRRTIFILRGDRALSYHEYLYGDCSGEDDATCVEDLTSYVLAEFSSIQAQVVYDNCVDADELLTPKLRRLTETQFRNSIDAVFQTSSFDDDVWPDLGDSLPKIGMSGNANSLSVNTVNIDQIYNAVDSIIDVAMVQDSEIAACANAYPPGITREWWSDISGSSVASLTDQASYPNSPTGVEALTEFSGPENWGDSYGSRIKGVLYPPVTGNYTFWVSGDDNIALNLSTDGQEANGVTIATVPEWTMPLEWDRFPQQQSTSVLLQAGTGYYIEAIHKEGGGGDSVAVGWQRPDSSSIEVISADFFTGPNGVATQETCLEELLVSHGPSIWRRPLAQTETDGLLAVLDQLESDGASMQLRVRHLLRSLLMSTNFLFRWELGSLQNSTRALNTYELANLLAYGLWDAPPDSELYALASNGELLQEGIVEQQVIRMTADPRFNVTYANFLKDFLKLESVLTVVKDDSVGITTAMREALLASAELTLTDLSQDIDQPLLSLFDDTTFYANSTIAPILGLETAGLDDTFQPITTGANERNGILTHPAFLTVHSATLGSGIVKRGVFTIEQMSCDHFENVPADIDTGELPDDIDPETTSTRDLLSIQHSSNSNCSSCHRTIDPAGYGYEHFDTLGRYRDFEKGSVPIDASGELELEQDTIAFDDHVEFVNEFKNTVDARHCVVKRALEKFSGESLELNHCEVNQLIQRFDESDGSIGALISSIIELESFRLRGQ